MPSLINDPEHWLERAKEARALAEKIVDPVAKRTMLAIAEGYEKLAKRATERAQLENRDCLEADSKMYPILPIVRKNPFDHPDWTFEFKYVGFATSLTPYTAGCCPRNRNHLERYDVLLSRLPHSAGLIMHRSDLPADGQQSGLPCGELWRPAQHRGQGGSYWCSSTVTDWRPPWA
jgi:hypothetical protein